MNMVPAFTHPLAHTSLKYWPGHITLSTASTPFTVCDHQNFSSNSHRYNRFRVVYLLEYWGACKIWTVWNIDISCKRSDNET
jgi:hypothetical protein